MTNQTNSQEPCIPCEKKKIYSQQFKNKDVIVERKTTEKVASVVNAADDFFTKKTERLIIKPINNG